MKGAARARWIQARRNLRRFLSASGWTVRQVAAALREGYGFHASAGLVAGLLDRTSPLPLDMTGCAAVAALCRDYSRAAPPSYDEWLRRRRDRDPARWRSAGDALADRAIAVETERAERQRTLLAAEARHGGRGTPPPREFDGLDAATITALSGGTIVRRGPHNQAGA